LLVTTLIQKARRTVNTNAAFALHLAEGEENNVDETINKTDNVRIM
jgi:hypothetical protein